MSALQQVKRRLKPFILPYRKAKVLAFYHQPILSGPALRYLLFDKETTNFTYPISNLEEMRDFLAAALPADPSQVWRYIQEIQSDVELRDSLRHRLRTRPDRNAEPHYGRRIGWYCIVRLRKPRLAVETGTHDGLGSSVLGRALYRNAQEGHPGELLTFDIMPESGWLINPSLMGSYRIVLGDTRSTLVRTLTGRQVDVFIHDSQHTYENESFEMETVSRYLSSGAVIQSDNAHSCTAMKDFCARHGLSFHLFMEKPENHFYHGASIGLALWRG